jgi:hypothetical protein
MAKKNIEPENETGEVAASPGDGAPIENETTGEPNAPQFTTTEKPAKPAKRSSAKGGSSAVKRAGKAAKPAAARSGAKAGAKSAAKPAAARSGAKAGAKSAAKGSRSAKALEDTVAKKLLASVAQQGAPASQVAEEQPAPQEKPKSAGEKLEEKVEEFERRELHNTGFEKKVDIDFWLTKLHGPDIGIYEKDRLMARNRMVTRNLSFIGGIKEKEKEEKGKKDSFFGIENDIWELDGKDLAAKRMVIRWFASESVEHLGTIEQMVCTSVAASLSVNDNIPVFKMIIPDYDFILDLKKEHPKVPRIDEQYTCILKDVRKDKKYWMPITFDEKIIALGSDWNVKAIFNGEKRIVANVDEKLLNIGHKYVATFYDSELYHYAPFYRTVIMFGVMLRYRVEIKERIARIRELLESGKMELEVSPEEEKLLWNPRYLTNYGGTTVGK